MAARKKTSDDAPPRPTAPATDAAGAAAVPDSATPAANFTAPASFEEAIDEVEAIVREMEEDRVPLDKLLERYERGTRLLEFCQSRIDSAQERIEMITTSRDGARSLEPFHPQTASGSGPATVPPRQDRARDDDAAAEDEPAADEIRLF